MRRRNKILAFAALAAPILVLSSVYITFPRGRLDPAPLVSLRLEDRNGVLLREVLSDEGGRCRWLEVKDISPFLLKATVAAEDRGFFLHRGIAPLSMLRALVQNVRHGRIVSGASTITQQLVRNLGRGPRSVPVKLKEAWLALRLENTLSKEAILLQYLNRICYGNQAYGAEAAARLYFDKPASDLSLAESALLAVVPRSPAALDPFRRPAAAKARQERLLDEMAGLGIISGQERDRARSEPLLVRSGGEAWRAPHFCDHVLAQLPERIRREAKTVRTTIDLVLQTKVEKQLRGQIRELESRGATNGAVVVIDNETGDVLAWVGSGDYWDDRHDGQVNGVLALRQPGSALKPFTYALALERGMTAATLIEDAALEFETPGGFYRPRNYDGTYHGRVRLRTALACSYNVPAVSVLQSVGPDLLFRRLKSLGFDSLAQSPGYYSVGLTLGNAEVTLLELARSYATLARGGKLRRTRAVLAIFDRSGGPLFEAGLEQPVSIIAPLSAFIITHILSDHDARVPAFGRRSPLNLPFPAAVKTGTTKDCRDNWAIGYTPAVTVGVWVGNFDGRPMHGVSGVTGCGPLFRDIMLLLHGAGPALTFREPPGLSRIKICPVSGELPTDSCPGTVEEIFIEGTEPRRACPSHGPAAAGLKADAAAPSHPAARGPGLRVVFPRDGDVFKLDPILKRDYQTVTVRASCPSATALREVEWWINGRRAARTGTSLSFSWNLRPGSYTIKVTASDGRGRIESRPVKVQVVA